MNDFRLIKLGDVAIFRNGLNFNKSSSGQKIKIIGVSDFKNRISPNYEELEEIQVDGELSKEDYLHYGDIVFVRSNGNKDLVARSLFIDKNVELSFSGFCIKARIINETILSRKFFLYFTKTSQFKYAVSKGAIGTNINNLNQSILNDLIVPTPKIETQYLITKVLSDFDSKIELNNRINAELEGMAKLIYDYWFVQFDFPDANGKPYKTSGGKMAWNTELKREIPEGWEVKELKKIANTGSGGTPLSTRQDYYENGNIPWINSGEVNKPFIVKAEKFITEAGLINSSAKMFRKGTILMAMYGATAGKVSMIDIEACTNQAICGINPNYDYYDTFVKIGLEDLYKYLVNLSSGSARDNLSQDKIRELKFIIPSDELLKEFHKKVNSSMLKILMNLKENQKLTELRDWLLPMLMNGQVRVAEDSGEMGIAAEGEREEYNAIRKT
jgi:type I restriction enzyme S subunit